MKRSREDINARKLLDRLPPDRNRQGHLLGILATTYELDPYFFETDFLPTLLGLGAWDDRSWSNRMAMERELARMEAVAVLMDGGAGSRRPRWAPRWIPRGFRHIRFVSSWRRWRG
jgi:hypothetical protein